MKLTMKTLEQYFADWESYVFGFGYGTGEIHTLKTLKDFIDLLKPNDYGNNPYCYDYEVLENALTPTTAWLMINILCKDNLLSYGTSARHGWWELDERAVKLIEFIKSHTVEELYDMCMQDEKDFCTPQYCNCDDRETNVKCKNPFF